MLVQPIRNAGEFLDMCLATLDDHDGPAPDHNVIPAPELLAPPFTFAKHKLRIRVALQGVQNLAWIGAARRFCAFQPVQHDGRVFPGYGGPVIRVPLSEFSIETSRIGKADTFFIQFRIIERRELVNRTIDEFLACLGNHFFVIIQCGGDNFALEALVIKLLHQWRGVEAGRHTKDIRLFGQH